MSTILKYHKIGYHVYADDSQQPLEAILKVNSCLSDIRRWMITNKLKINDSKTEFIVFRSPQLRCDLSGLSVNVGESQITQSLKVRDLDVTFDQFLNSALCCGPRIASLPLPMWLTSGRSSGRKKKPTPILFISIPGKGVL